MEPLSLFCLKSMFSSSAWDNLNHKGASLLSWLDQWLSLVLSWGKNSYINLRVTWWSNTSKIFQEVIGIFLFQSCISKFKTKFWAIVICMKRDGKWRWLLLGRTESTEKKVQMQKHLVNIQLLETWKWLLSGKQLHWLIKCEVCESANCW